MIRKKENTIRQKCFDASLDSKGKVLIFSAPSGAGKTTIVHHLLGKFPALEFSISATSRAPRGNEKDGMDYYFMTPEAFREKIARNEFLEWEEVYAGNYYGTTKSEAERVWGKGRVLLCDVDVKGGLNIKRTLGNRALAVFVQPPSVDVLRERLQNRNTDTPEAIERRLRKAKEELSCAPQFDKIIINDHLEKTLKEAETLVAEFLQKEKK
ncbi:MAG: guanylate kinase [Prevotellaceae bacterium]|jgi:guanylate kinase|nr:guanylate kinase [Prevotellaceae bacterium]